MWKKILKYNLIVLYAIFSYLFIMELHESSQKVVQKEEVIDLKPRKVLYINSYHRGFDWSDDIEEATRKRLRARFPTIDITTIYLDSKRYEPSQFEPITKDLIVRKFGERSNFDIVLSADNNALDFCLKLRASFLKDRPIIFCGVNNFSPQMISGYDDIGGVIESIDVVKNISLIKKLHPNMKYMAYINDRTTTGLRIQEIVDSSIPLFPEIKFIPLINLSADELGARLDSLPEGGVILHLSFWLDRKGRSFSVSEGLQFTRDHSDKPVYVIFEPLIQQGAIGGVVNSARDQGEVLADLATKFFKDQTLSIVQGRPLTPIFDHRALKIHNIKESDLPVGSIVFNKDVSYGPIPISFTALIILAFLAILVVIILISEVLRRRNLEKEIRKNSENLENKVRQRTKELEDQISKSQELTKSLLYSERLAAVGTLASGVAHEFNNINTAVLGFAELAKYHENLPSEVYSYLDRIIMAGKRSKTIANNMLSFARAERRDYSNRRGNLCECVITTLDLVRRSFEVEGIKIVPNLMPVSDTRIDPDLINQVILNLLTNSKHAMARSKEKVIKILVKETPNELVLKMEDSGSGIPEDYIDQIFKPFFTTKSPNAESSISGSGLGLSICQRIIKDHGGSISVDSFIGLGTSFLITLPLDLVDLPLSSNEVWSDISLEGKRVLTVDDEDHVVEILGLMLGRAGCYTSGTTNAVTALELIRHEHFDLCLLDLQMPGLDGFSFIEEWAQDPELKSTPIAVITGKQISTVEDALRERGVSRILQKPFTVGELVNLVAEIVSCAGS